MDVRRRGVYLDVSRRGVCKDVRRRGVCKDVRRGGDGEGGGDLPDPAGVRPGGVVVMCTVMQSPLR